MSTGPVSGASERYGLWLLNMVGSVQTNSPIFDRIVLFDLGLSPRQRRLVRAIQGAELRTVPPFVPHWREGRTWKTWIWTHVDCERLLWLDAGLTVLRPLDALLAQIEERDSVVLSQPNPVADRIPADVSDPYRLRRLAQLEGPSPPGDLEPPASRRLRVSPARAIHASHRAARQALRPLRQALLVGREPQLALSPADVREEVRPRRPGTPPVSRAL